MPETKKTIVFFEGDDDKAFLEAELSDLKPQELDDSLFDKP